MKKLGFLVFVLVMALPYVAGAQGTVTVLGLRSATADEGIAERVRTVRARALEAADGAKVS